MKLIHLLSFILVMLGGLNWTLVGLLDVNLFTMFTGGGVLTMLLYLWVTVATLLIVIPRMVAYLHTN